VEKEVLLDEAERLREDMRTAASEQDRSSMDNKAAAPAAIKSAEPDDEEEEDAETQYSLNQLVALGGTAMMKAYKNIDLDDPNTTIEYDTGEGRHLTVAQINTATTILGMADH